VPGYGRLEIEPPTNRKLPPRAARFHHSWSAESAPRPAQIDPPYYPPPVIYAPQVGDFGTPHDFPGPLDFHPRTPESLHTKSIREHIDRSKSCVRRFQDWVRRSRW
jgi:hypothetical protein